MSTVCRTFLESNQRKVFGIFEVKKIHDHGGSSDRLLALTDAYVCYFKDNIKDKTYTWIELTYISLDDKIIILEFGSEDNLMRFIPDNLDQVREIIGCIIQRVLTTYEYEDLELSNFTKYKYRPTPNSLIARFNCSAIQSGTTKEIKDFPNVVEFAKKLFSTKRKVISLTPDQINCLAVPMMRTVQAADYIESLEFPEPLSIDIFDILSKYVSDDFPPLHIQITGEATESFQTFIDELNETNALIGLSFKNSNFTKAQLQILENIRNSSLTCLSLQNSYSNEIIGQEYRTSALFRNLKMLNLDYTQNVDFQDLYDNCPHLISLSVAYCNLELNDILHVIFGKHKYKMKMLNISGNLCSQLNVQNLFMPQSLIRFDVADVKWSDNAFQQMFELIFTSNFPYGIYINFSNAQMTENDTKMLNLTLKSMPTKCVCGLDWSNNPIPKNFNNFIARCENLRELNVSGCYSAENKDSLVELGNSLAKLQKFQSITLIGTPEKHIAEHAVEFINNLSGAFQLNTINLANQQINQQAINILLDLTYLNKNIFQLSFKGNSASIEGIYNSLKRFEDTKRTILIDDFTDEINNAATTPHSKAIAKCLINLIAFLQKGGVIEDKPDGIEIPFDDIPFGWTMPDSSRFPMYINQEIEHLVTKPLIPGMTVFTRPRKFSLIKDISPSDDKVHIVYRKRISDNESDSGMPRRKTNYDSDDGIKKNKIGRKLFISSESEDESDSELQHKTSSGSRSTEENSEPVKKGAIKFKVEENEENKEPGKGIAASGSLPNKISVNAAATPKKVKKRKRSSTVNSKILEQRHDSNSDSIESAEQPPSKRHKLPHTLDGEPAHPKRRRKSAIPKDKIEEIDQKIKKPMRKSLDASALEKKKTRKSVQFNENSPESDFLNAVKNEILITKRASWEFPLKPVEEIAESDVIKQMKEKYSLTSLTRTVFFED